MFIDETFFVFMINQNKTICLFTSTTTFHFFGFGNCGNCESIEKFEKISQSDRIKQFCLFL